jgi:hypothetical protein
MFCLSPFLNKGFISEYFRRSGNIPNESDLLHMWVNGLRMKGELSFNNLLDISSQPCEYFFVLRDLITFLISFVDNGISLKLGKVLLKDWSKQWVGVVMYLLFVLQVFRLFLAAMFSAIDVKCVLKVSAIFFIVVFQFITNLKFVNYIILCRICFACLHFY